MEEIMFRVIYEWHVSKANFDAFERIWSDMTNHIHNTVPGALGSFLVRSTTTPEKVLTVAKWESRSCWESFFQNRNPEEMQAMRQIAERVSVEGFDEIADHTKSNQNF